MDGSSKGGSSSEYLSSLKMFDEDLVPTSLFGSSMVNESLITSSSFFSSVSPEVPPVPESPDYIPYVYRIETYLVPLVFAVIFAIGFIGNGSLIFIFVKHKSLRNVPNTFIMCLAVGDMMVIVGTIPFISLIYTLDSWPFGTFICKLSEFTRDLSIGVTSLSLMVLSIDRYLAIAMALKQLKMNCRSKKMAYCVSAIVWATAITLAIPGAYTSYVMEHQVSNTTVIRICYPFPTEWIDWYPKIMVTTKFVVLYVVPLAFISISYFLLARHLLLTKRKAKASGVPTPLNYQNQLKSRAKVAKLVLTFVVIFVISFLPNHIFLLWFYYTYPTSMENYNSFWHYFKIAGYVLSFANSCTNPIVLYVSSGRFRTYYRQYLCCLRTQKLHYILRYNHANNTGSGASRSDQLPMGCNNNTLSGTARTNLLSENRIVNHTTQL